MRAPSFQGFPLAVFSSLLMLSLPGWVRGQSSVLIYNHLNETFLAHPLPVSSGAIGGSADLILRPKSGGLMVLSTEFLPDFSDRSEFWYNPTLPPIFPSAESSYKIQWKLLYPPGGMTGIRPVAIDEDENGGINVYGNTASSSSDKIYAAWVKGTWDAPIPRFGAEVTSALPFHINLCSTNLLFPYPTPAATTCVGIAIANGSGKPYSALWNPGDNTVKDISAYFPPDSSDGKVMAVNETGRAVLRSYDKQFKPQFGLIDLGTANPASRVFNLPDPCNSINTHFVGYRRDILAMTCYYPGADNTLQSHAVYINTDTSALSELDPVKFPVSSTAVGGTVLTDPGNIWYPGFTQTGVQTPGSASLSVFPEDGSGLTPLQASIGGEADLGSFLPAQYITSQATSIDSQGDVGGAACTGVFGPCDPVVWTPNKIQAGDVNADASVDVSDVVLVLQSVVGLTTLTLDQVRAADAVGDNVVDVNDAVKILRVVVGLDPGF